MQTLHPTTSVTPAHGQTQDSELWFADGSVVLETDDVYFKVYSGILSQASPVFKDMFAFPQPIAGTSDAESYDGCPLVHMPDAARDLRYFLKALHDSRYVPCSHVYSFV